MAQGGHKSPNKLAAQVSLVWICAEIEILCYAINIGNMYLLSRGKLVHFFFLFYKENITHQMTKQGVT